MPRRHRARIRPLALSWHRDTGGTWVPDGVADGHWELYCGRCGDTGGPAGHLPPVVRALRGPYRGTGRARLAALRHRLRN
jgi:hypothetical protein